MTPHELHPEKSGLASSTEKALLVGVGSIPFGCSVAPHVLERQWLTSVHRNTAREELWETTIGRPRTTSDNPFLGEVEAKNLDDGLIRLGTVFAEHDVLASIVVAESTSRAEPPEAGMRWVTDNSLRLPRSLHGATVTSAERWRGKQLGRRPTKGLLERIEIRLHVERALAIVVSLKCDSPIDRAKLAALVEMPPGIFPSCRPIGLK